MPYIQYDYYKKKYANILIPFHDRICTMYNNPGFWKFVFECDATEFR